MSLKRQKCSNISDMFRACAQPSSRQTTMSMPPTHGDGNIHTPPLTGGTLGTSHISETNVSAHSSSIRSDSISSLSESSSELPPCWVLDGHFMPRDKEHVNEISRIIKSAYTGSWPTYKSVPQNIKNQWWAEFQNYFKVEPQYKRAVRKLFDTKASDIMSESLYNARQKWFGEHRLVDWIDQEVMNKLLKHWDSGDWKNQSVKNKSNRCRVTSDGRAVAKSNGGSRSFYDTKLYLDNDMGREVCSAEVYIAMHTSNLVGKIRGKCCGKFRGKTRR